MIVQVITVRLVQTQNHGNLRPADGSPARLLFQLGDARRTESLMPTRYKRKSCITLLDETHFAHILRSQEHSWRRNLVLFLVDSCIPARQWTDICNTRCSILSRFSHFHVSHFPPLQHGAAFPCPAISCLAFSASPCTRRVRGCVLRRAGRACSGRVRGPDGASRRVDATRRRQGDGRVQLHHTNMAHRLSA